jgi:hypothetical protein
MQQPRFAFPPVGVDGQDLLGVPVGCLIAAQGGIPASSKPL